MGATRRRVEWLGSVATWANTLSIKGRPGIFGTSIAATWLLGERPDVEFFVDEDPSRIGQEHQGRPILGPADVPSGSGVLVALPPALAAAVAGRLGRLDVSYHLPPPILLDTRLSTADTPHA